MTHMANRSSVLPRPYDFYFHNWFHNRCSTADSLYIQKLNDEISPMFPFGFNNFGHQHLLSFYIVIWPQRRHSVTDIKNLNHLHNRFYTLGTIRGFIR